MSETAKCRPRLQQYCIGYGIDLGYGGDPIIPSAITIDLPSPYSHVGEASLNLGGDAQDLFWFKDNVFDYVFSSHLLEDFDNTEVVLKEWLRVLKSGGNLILFCPVEQIYRKHCPGNVHHKIENFGLEYIKEIIKTFPHIKIIHENALCDIYSFEIVIQKC